MGKIIIDKALEKKLKELADQVELCGEDGSSIGRFVPNEASVKALYEALNETPEEKAAIERSFQDPGGKTLKEIWKRLGSQ